MYMLDVNVIEEEYRTWFLKPVPYMNGNSGELHGIVGKTYSTQYVYVYMYMYM